MKSCVDIVRAPLFVPANRPDRFTKAAASRADAVILDLEDAVSPSEKDLARQCLDCSFTELPVIVRINAVNTPWFEYDLAAVRALPIAGVMLPKAEEPGAVAGVCDSLTGHAPVIALLEDARGLSEARRIATVPGVARLAFGSIDFCADLGCAHLRDALLPARLELVLASRLAGIAAPLDGVTEQVDDSALTFDDAAHARSLGMTGKMCVHPLQISAILRAFTPALTEIDWAKRVLASGDGAVMVDGAMVDEPVRRRARSILDAAI